MNTETPADLTPAQQSALAIIRTRGHARLAMATNPLLGEVGSRTAYALAEKGLVRTWARRDGVEAVIPGSERDHDVDNIDA